MNPAPESATRESAVTAATTPAQNAVGEIAAPCSGKHRWKIDYYGRQTWKIPLEKRQPFHKAPLENQPLLVRASPKKKGAGR